MNTRFNPTANGYLHIGHLYVILVNYHTAVKNGGKFICRFDDDQYGWINILGKEKINNYCDSIKEDMDWLNIPTTYSYESKEKEANEAFIKKLEPISRNIPASFEEITVARVTNQSRPYPFVPYLTAVKVAQDYREKINPVIRGDDLLSEFSLYCYFCQTLNLPMPEQFFVPKLMKEKNFLYGQSVLEDLSDVSKTDGCFKIRDFREKGYKPEEVIKTLANSCLQKSDAEWSYKNIKKQPILIG